MQYLVPDIMALVSSLLVGLATLSKLDSPAIYNKMYQGDL